MSPLSDTTNLASSIVGVDLFEHIRNMGWTTVPAFILSLIFFGILSPGDRQYGLLIKSNYFKKGLLQTGMIHGYTVIPLIVLFLLTILKVPALMTLAISSFSVRLSFLISIKVSALSEVFGILFGGFVSTTGIADIDKLISGGGMESMMFTIGLVLLALVWVDCYLRLALCNVY